MVNALSASIIPVFNAMMIVLLLHCIFAIIGVHQVCLQFLLLFLLVLQCHPVPMIVDEDEEAPPLFLVDSSSLPACEWRQSSVWDAPTSFGIASFPAPLPPLLRSNHWHQTKLSQTIVEEIIGPN